MQAAFIDIGLDINAFLPFSEIGNTDSLKHLSFDENEKNQRQIKREIDIN